MSVFSYNQSGTGTNAATATFGSTNTSGNLLLLIGGGFDSTVATGASDTLGNTWNLLAQTVTGSGGQYIYYAINASTGSNTCTISGAGTTNMYLVCAEYNVPANYLISREEFLSFNSSTSTSYTFKYPFLTEGSPNVPSEIMLIFAFYDENSAHSWTVSNGNKRLDANPGSGTAFLYGDYDTTTSPASTAISTFASSGKTAGIGVVLSLPGSGGGGGVVVQSFDAGMLG